MAKELSDSELLLSASQEAFNHRFKRQWCPVCGRLHLLHQPCNPAILRAIDAANERAERESSDPERNTEPFYRTQARRLNEGFSLLLSGEDE